MVFERLHRLRQTHRADLFSLLFFENFKISEIRVFATRISRPESRRAEKSGEIAWKKMRERSDLIFAESLERKM